jgi:uncharacterized protein
VLAAALLLPRRRLNMHDTVEHDELDEALRRCGASWSAAQAHGLLCSRLAVRGRRAGREWIEEVLRESDAANALRGECRNMLEDLYGRSYRQLAERQSEFEPLLPDDESPASARADALAHWCEGFLHGLVSGPHGESLKAKLASEPLSDIIRDTLEITRATAEADGDSDEEAWTELVEYLRVATQLAFEELAAVRSPDEPGPAAQGGDVIH